MKPRVKAWVVFPGGTKFGEGRARLLRLVAEEGSLRGAVKRMGMSYRAAWGYLKELERAAGHAFLEPAGRGRAKGAALTPEARRFLAAFAAFHRRLQGSSAATFRAAFARRAGRRPKPARRKPRRAAAGAGARS
jgi:molybdate transport system regulatory protein